MGFSSFLPISRFLQGNLFSGGIPASWESLPLLALDLSNNNLTSIPDFLADVPSINLQNNLFPCPLPPWCDANNLCAPCVPLPSNSASSSSSVSSTPSF